MEIISRSNTRAITDKLYKKKKKKKKKKPSPTDFHLEFQLSTWRTLIEM